MVTNQRLRWVPFVNLVFESSLRFDDVSVLSEEEVKHRYAIALDHKPIVRMRPVPAHRFLRFK